MITLHIGWPKTATTSLQRVLSSSSQLLQASGILYPGDFRNVENIAHHALAQEIHSGSAGDPQHVPRLFELAENSEAPGILISSEAFTNCLSGEPAERFYAVLAALRKWRTVRLVMAVRRLDEFVQSMYLQSVKVAETDRSIDVYVDRRWQWGQAQIRGVSEMRDHALIDEFEILRFDRQSGYAESMFRAFGVPDDAIAAFPELQRVNESLGAKAQSVLLHLEQASQRIGAKLDRWPLIHAFIKGKLAFDDEVTRYWILTPGQRHRLHTDMVEASRDSMMPEYDDFFWESSAADRPYVQLVLDILSENDWNALRDYAQTVQREHDDGGT